jgi:hypothetical protein
MKAASNTSSLVLNHERLRHRVLSPQPMNATAAGLSYGLLFIPYVLAWLTVSVPMLSYGLSWTGSWWILALTLKGYIKPLPGGGFVNNSCARSGLRTLRSQHTHLSPLSSMSLTSTA